MMKLQKMVNQNTFVDHLIHMEDEGWETVLAVNLNGAFYACREAVRIMAEDNYARFNCKY